MNAGGVSKACKSNAFFGKHGKRESNTWATYLEDEDNPAKAGIILDSSGEILSLFT